MISEHFMRTLLVGGTGKAEKVMYSVMGDMILFGIVAFVVVTIVGWMMWKNAAKKNRERELRKEGK